MTENATQSQYRRLSDEEVKEIALKIWRHEAFPSWYIRKGDEQDACMIFMPLLFLDDDAKAEMRRDGIEHFIGFNESRMPRDINGYPCFAAYRPVNVDDANRIRNKTMEMAEAFKAL